MKTPTFWYRSPGFLSALLSPFSLFFILGSSLRRLRATPYRAQRPVICIGNIGVGGSGKTPTAIALAEILQQAGMRPAFVTRGYGGSLSGPLFVDPAKHTAKDVGDEALLLARTAPVFMGRDRVAAVKLAEGEASHIIMDDGLQNPNIDPHMSLLVIDGVSGFGNGCILPAGPLRETYIHARPRIAAAVMIGADIQHLTPMLGVPVLRAELQIALPPEFPRMGKFIAFAGIGRPGKFYQSCREAGLTLAGTRDFSDHHVFTVQEFDALRTEAAKHEARLLTTEKDWVRLPPAWRSDVVALPAHLHFASPEQLTMLVQSLSITAPREPS